MLSEETNESENKETEDNDNEVSRCVLPVDNDVSQPDKITEDKTKLESELRKKQIMLQENVVWIDDISEELTSTFFQMKECEQENECLPMQINSINMKISELEDQLSRLKQSKQETEEKLDDYTKKIEEFSLRKSSLDAELSRRVEIGRTMEAEVVDLKKKILLKSSKRKNLISHVSQDPNKRLLRYLIEKKEKDLECPVCLVTASVPIYSCAENHMICSVCRPQMAECPECRVEYSDNKRPRRHRYAEKMVEELDIMKKEID